MTNRLTNDIRAAIANNAIIHRFAAEIEALRLQYAALAIVIYDSEFKKEIPQFAKIADGWLPTDEKVTIKFGEQFTNLLFNGDFWANHYAPTANTHNISYRQFPTPQAVQRVFPANKLQTCIAVYEATHACSLRFEELQNRRKDLNERIGLAKAQTISTLEKFNTFTKLFETWPEIEPFTKGIAAAPKPQLPAVPVMELNKMLDLPVPEDAAE